LTNIKIKNKDKRLGTSEQLHIAAWNVRGLCHKETEPEEELTKMKADVAIITETKKKLKGTR
jgi:hypothetical protein